MSPAGGQRGDRPSGWGRLPLREVGAGVGWAGGCGHGASGCGVVRTQCSAGEQLLGRNNAATEWGPEEGARERALRSGCAADMWRGCGWQQRLRRFLALLPVEVLRLDELQLHEG